MNSDTQLKVQSYLDNELSPGEARKVASMISSDRDAQMLYEELRTMREILGQNEPAVKLEESRDFYWSKIQKGIIAAERAPIARSSASPWWVRLLAPVLGTAALFALLISVMNPGTTIATKDRGVLAVAPLHGEVEDLAPAMSSATFRSEQDGVTVVWLSARE